MEDAEEPIAAAYDLNPVMAYVDEDGKPVESLVVCDRPREINIAAQADPALAGILYLTANHIALWQCIRGRTLNGGACTKSQLRQDLRTLGLNVDKKFTRWLDKPVNAGLVTVSGENVLPTIPVAEVGE